MRNHPAFQSRPGCRQFAKDGAWENGLYFPADAPPSRAGIDAFLAGAGEVAFEAFFGDAFFGVRWTGAAQHVGDLSLASVQALQAASDGAGFFAELTARTGFCGWGRGIAFTEMGAVNAWRTVGPFKAAAPGEALQAFDGVWVALQSSPMARNTSHPKAVEFACLQPVPHWFALPISAPLPPFECDSVALRRALEFAARTGDAGA